VSWWWVACTVILVVAAVLVAGAARRVEVERAALTSALDGLDPLRTGVADLHSDLARTAARAAERRARLSVPASRRTAPPADGPPGGRRGWEDGHR
jgi:hypothetical protein